MENFHEVSSGIIDILVMQKMLMRFRYFVVKYFVVKYFGASLRCEANSGLWRKCVDYDLDPGIESILDAVIRMMCDGGQLLYSEFS